MIDQKVSFSVKSPTVIFTLCLSCKSCFTHKVLVCGASDLESTDVGNYKGTSSSLNVLNFEHFNYVNPLVLSFWRAGVASVCNMNARMAAKGFPN
jgi:hypothetical protein